MFIMFGGVYMAFIGKMIYRQTVAKGRGGNGRQMGKTGEVGGVGDVDYRQGCGDIGLQILDNNFQG